MCLQSTMSRSRIVSGVLGGAHQADEVWVFYEFVATELLLSLTVARGSPSRSTTWSILSSNRILTRCALLLSWSVRCFRELTATRFRQSKQCPTSTSNRTRSSREQEQREAFLQNKILELEERLHRKAQSEEEHRALFASQRMACRPSSSFAHSSDASSSTARPSKAVASSSHNDGAGRVASARTAKAAESFAKKVRWNTRHSKAKTVYWTDQSRF